MPRRIVADGKTYVVPDDATPDEVNQIVGPATPPSAPKPGITDPRGGFSPLDFFRGGLGAVKSAFEHPIQTMESMGEPFLATMTTPDAIPMGVMGGGKSAREANRANENAQREAMNSQMEQAEFMKKNPAYAAGGIILPALALHGAGEFATKVVSPAFRAGLESLTKTGPRETKNLVAETRESNAKALALASDANAKAEKAHLVKTREALHENVGRELLHKAESKVANEFNAKATQEHQQAVEVTDAANKAKMDEHVAKTRSVEQDNFQNRTEYEAAKAKVEELEKAAKEQSTQRGQLSRQISQQSARLIERLKTIKSAWKDSSELQRKTGYKPIGKLDVMYDRLRKATAGQSIPIEGVGDAVRKAQEKLKGSSESIKQFIDILSKEKAGNDDEFVYHGGQKFGPGTALYESVKGSEEGIPGESAKPLGFGDLQGYYTEIGSKLAPGNLLPDVYQALRSLQDDLGGMMRGMAARSNVPSLFDQAQAAYRDYMQTFRESTGPNHSGSPISQALDAKDPAYAIKPLTNEETAQRVRNILSRFDLQANGQGGAAALYDNLRQANQKFDSLGKPIKVPSVPSPPIAKETPVAPPLQARPSLPTPHTVEPLTRVAPPDRPPEVLPETKKIGTEDVRAAKQAGLDKRTNVIRHRGEWIATGVAGYRLLANVLHGNFAAIPQDIFEGAVVVGGVEGLARLLENPRVAKLLTNPTERDLAQIPPELRGDLSAVVQQAQKQGMKVSPLVLAAVGSGAQNRPKHPTFSTQSPVQ